MVLAFFLVNVCFRPLATATISFREDGMCGLSLSPSLSLSFSLSLSLSLSLSIGFTHGRTLASTSNRGTGVINRQRVQLTASHDGHGYRCPVMILRAPAMVSRWPAKKHTHTHCVFPLVHRLANLCHQLLSRQIRVTPALHQGLLRLRPGKAHVHQPSHENLYQTKKHAHKITRTIAERSAVSVGHINYTQRWSGIMTGTLAAGPLAGTPI